MGRVFLIAWWTIVAALLLAAVYLSVESETRTVLSLGAAGMALEGLVYGFGAS